MRHLPTGRGQHHKCTSSTARMFAFAEGSGASLTDLIGGTGLTVAGSPTWGTDGWLGPSYLSFDGVNDKATGGGVGADTATLVANAWTLGFVWRRRANAAGVMFTCGGNGATAATNVLVRLKHDAAGALTVEWESGVNVLRSAAVPGYALPLDRWVYGHLVRISATAVEVWIGARLVATLDMVAANATGTSAVWSIGCDEAGANFVTGDCGSLYLEAARLTITTLATDVRRAMLWAFPTAVHARVRVEDGDGDLIDLTDLEGHDWLERIQIDESVEDAAATLKVELTREHDFLSLAFLITSSKLNLTDPMDLASYDPLVYLQREIYADFARTPHGHGPETTDWCNRFFGHIDRMDPAQNPIPVDARDPGGRLVDDFINPRDADGNPVDLDRPLTSGGDCATDPDTGERRASPEEAIEDIIGEPVWAPNPANLCLVPWQQKKDSKAAIARSIAGVKAWDFRSTFDESPAQNTWRPTLVDPGRDRVDGDGVFSGLDYEALSKHAIDVFGIRNAIDLTWPNKANRNSDDEKLPRTTTYEDTDSRDKFGGFFRRMFVTEGSTSPIDELAEADVMGEGMLADLKDPTIEQDAPINDCAFEVERNDYHTFLADNVHATGDLVLATTAISLSYSDGAGETTIGCRGKATAGQRRWLAMDTRPGMNPAPWTDLGSGGAWGDEPNERRRSVANVIDYTSWFSGPEGAVLNRNSGFGIISRGNTIMPDLWFRSTATTGLQSLDPLSAGRLSTLHANTTVDRAVTRSKNVCLKLGAGATPQVSSELFAVEAGTVLGLDATAMRADTFSNVYVVAFFYDVDKALVSSSTEVVFLNGGVNITAIDDTGAGGTVVITTSRAHRLSVGEVCLVGRTSSFDRTYTVAEVISSTSIRTSEAQTGAAETSGRLGGFVTTPTLGILVPPSARYAVIAVVTSDILPSLAEPVYLDAVRARKIDPDFFVYYDLVDGAETASSVAKDTWTRVIYTAESYNFGSHFSLADDEWVCPETGLYDVISQVKARVTFRGGDLGNFRGLKARLLLVDGDDDTVTYLSESPSTYSSESGSSNPATGSCQCTYSGFFNKGDRLRHEYQVSLIAGLIDATPVRQMPGLANTFLRASKRA